MWHGRQSRLVAVSIVAASGFRGAQCHGLVGPNIPIEGVPRAAATCRSPESFDTAIATWSRLYADQSENDHAALVAAVKSGRLEAHEGV